MNNIHDVIQYYKPVHRIVTQFHKNGKPKIINYGNYNNILIKIESYFSNGKLRARTILKNTKIIYVSEYYKNGNKKYEKWHNEINQSHRKYGPSYKEYYENGKIESLRYFINGRPHRINGPAIIDYYMSGHLHSEVYCINGLYHRIDGPAYIGYDHSGNAVIMEYWHKGNHYTNQVKYWMIHNKIYNLNDVDFNRMWMEIL